MVARILCTIGGSLWGMGALGAIANGEVYAGIGIIGVGMTAAGFVFTAVQR